jgi:hypothetical protein
LSIEPKMVRLAPEKSDVIETVSAERPIWIVSRFYDWA